MPNSTLPKGQQKSLRRKIKKMNRLAGQIAVLAEKIASDKNPAGLRNVRRAEKIIKIARQITEIKDQVREDTKLAKRSVRKRDRKKKVNAEARRIVKLAEMIGKAAQKMSRLASQIINEASGGQGGRKKMPASNNSTAGSSEDSALSVQTDPLVKVNDTNVGADSSGEIIANQDAPGKVINERETKVEPVNTRHLQQGKQEAEPQLLRPSVADRQTQVIPRRGFRANNDPKPPVKKDMRNCWTVAQCSDEWTEDEAKLMRNRLNGCTGFYLDSVNSKMRRFLFLRGGKWEKDILRVANSTKEISTVVHYDSVNSMEYSSRIVNNLTAIGPRA